MFTRIVAFFSDCRNEFRKLSWPTRPQAIRLTIIVFVICAAFSIFFGVIDYALNYLIDLII